MLRSGATTSTSPRGEERRNHRWSHQSKPDSERSPKERLLLSNWERTLLSCRGGSGQRKRRHCANRRDGEGRGCKPHPKRRDPWSIEGRPPAVRTRGCFGVLSQDWRWTGCLRLVSVCAPPVSRLLQSGRSAMVATSPPGAPTLCPWLARGRSLSARIKSRSANSHSRYGATASTPSRATPRGLRPWRAKCESKQACGHGRERRGQAGEGRREHCQSSH